MQINIRITAFNLSVVIAMNGQTGRMTARTGQLVKLKNINKIIIRNLRNRIVKISIKGYHKYVRAVVKHRLKHEAETKLLSGGFLPLYLQYVTR